MIRLASRPGLIVLAAALFVLAGAMAFAESTATVTEKAPVVLPVQETPSASGPAASENGGKPPEVAKDAMPAGLVAPEKTENAFLRFEIIAFGSLPITLFYSNLGFDLYRFVQNDFDSRYAPWPFQGSATSTLSDDERLQRIGAAALVSVGVAAADLLLRFIRDSGSKRAAASP